MNLEICIPDEIDEFNAILQKAIDYVSEEERDRRARLDMINKL